MPRWVKWPGDLDHLTLKVMSESCVTWATSVSILVFLGLCSQLRPDVCDRWTDVRQTDVRQHHRLMPLPIRGGGIIITTKILFEYFDYFFCTTTLASATFVVELWANMHQTGDMTLLSWPLTPRCLLMVHTPSLHQVWISLISHSEDMVYFPSQH